MLPADVLAKLEKLKAFSLRATQKAETEMKRKRTCLCHDCRAKSVDCHGIQKARLGYFAGERRKVVAINNSPIDSPMRYMRNFWDPTLALEEKIVGLDQATVFWGFCSRHDDELFADIEKQSIIWGDKHQAVVLGLRAIAAKLDQSRSLHAAFRGFINSAKFWGHMDDIRQLEAGAVDLSWHKNVNDPSEFKNYWNAVGGEQTIDHIWIRFTPCLEVAGCYTAIPWQADFTDEWGRRQLVPLLTLSVVPESDSTLIILTASGTGDLRVTRWMRGFASQLRNSFDHLSALLLSDQLVFSENLWESFGHDKQGAILAALATHPEDRDRAASLIMPRFFGLDDHRVEFEAFLTSETSNPAR